MARSRRTSAVLALVATTTMVAGLTAACSKNTNNSNTSDIYKNPVTLQWWHNKNTDGPGKTYWQKVADDFHALHPTVTIQITTDETNDLQRTKIPAAEQAGTLPDVFQAWGGGEIRDQAQAGYVQDITEATKDTVANMGPAASIWAVDGKQYGIPFQFGIEGFWYNKDMFTQAGISAPPKTLPELNDAVTKLKAKGFIPIAVGAGDAWPAAHWWYNFAVRECTAAALAAASQQSNFDDPCFIKAGDDVKAFVATQPFQPGFIATRGQDGPLSSAGLIATSKAAMELMGPWDSGSIASQTADQKKPEFLSWFPFPSVPGAGGNQTAQLGGGDGFACKAGAPPECAAFLNYIGSLEVEKGYGATGDGIPITKGSEVGIADPTLQIIAKATQDAGGIQLWLDTAFGASVGEPMNDAIVAIFAGTGDSQGVVTALKNATSR